MVLWTWRSDSSTSPVHASLPAKKHRNADVHQNHFTLCNVFSDLMKISSILLQISNIVLCILSYISWSGICFVIFTFFPKPCSGHFLFFHYIFPNVPLSRFCKHWSYVGWSPSQISRPSVLLVRLRHPFEPPNNWKSEFQSQAAQHLISYKL